MTDQPRTRQELYDRIREIGREEFILKLEFYEKIDSKKLQES